MAPEKYFKFFSIGGVVLSAKSSSERVYYEQHSTLANGSYLTSSLREQTSVWVTDSSGSEHNLRFSGQIPLREGHHLTVIYMAPQKAEKGSPIAAYNATARILVRHNIHKCRELEPYPVLSVFGALGVLFGLMAAFISFFFSFHSSTAATIFFFSLIGSITLAIISYRQMREKERRLEALIQSGICKALDFGNAIPSDVKVEFTS